MKIIDAIPVLDVQTFDTLMTNQMNVKKLKKFFKKNYFLKNDSDFFKGSSHGFVSIKFGENTIGTQREAGLYLKHYFYLKKF